MPDILLSIVTFLPLVGALIIFVLARGDEADVARNARQMAFFASVFTFVVSLFIWFFFERGSADFQFVERWQWIPEMGFGYHMGVDGISMLFVLLSTFLTPLCILCSWDSIKSRVKEYMIAFLLLETLMIGMFCALDFIVFYIFFEAVLIPMFLIIGVWGGPRRVYAAFKFFLYTLGGSVLMLLAILTIYLQTGTTDIPTLIANTQSYIDDGKLPPELQVWLWLGFMASFAVKVPMWPVHTWLPDAHVEAPTAGSVILAGVLLKMGAYGFLRFSLPMLPDASAFFAPLMFSLSIVAVIYTSLVALAQEDMKKLIAYSSVAHMGFVTLGTFTFTQQGIEGAIYQMLSHGVVSAGLFLIVGVVYDRIHSRMIDRYDGLVERMPTYAFTFMVLMLASVGLPGTGGFVGEFLVIVGAFQVNTLVALLAASGMVLGAAYMLYLYRRVIFGTISKEGLASILDMNHREKAIFLPLLVVTFWMGIYPASFIDVMSASVENLVANFDAAMAASAERGGVSLAGLLPGAN